MTARADLESAYRQARYQVDLPASPLAFVIGRHSPALADLLQQANAAGAALITAHNPGSRPTAATDNQRAQSRLARAVDAAGYTVLPGAARDPTGTWPDEPSLLVLDIDQPSAAALAARFDQNALVWIGSNGLPELLWIAAPARR